MDTNLEFYNLLKSLVEEQTFSLELFSSEEKVSCKFLTTIQLKELIKTVVDNPLTQSAFNTCCTRIFKESTLVSPFLNVLDRLVFLLQTRINSISPTTTLIRNEQSFVVDFADILNKLYQKKKSNPLIFSTKTELEGKVSVIYGIPLLEAELKLNEEIYKDLQINAEDPNEMRKILGDSFINEIAKFIQVISIGDKSLDLSTISFANRLKAVETLPASLIQKIINYIEIYKETVEECLTVEGKLITLDASLFSVK